MFDVRITLRSLFKGVGLSRFKFLFNFKNKICKYNIKNICHNNFKSNINYNFLVNPGITVNILYLNTYFIKYLFTNYLNILKMILYCMFGYMFM